MLLLAITHTVLLVYVAGLMIFTIIYEDDGEVVGAGLVMMLVLGVCFLIVVGVVSIFGKVHFGTYALYVFGIPYVVFSTVLLIFFLGRGAVSYARKKREARTTPDHEAIRSALEAGRMSEAMRLYKVVNCLNEDNVKSALEKILQILTNWPIRNVIYEATRELLALQHNSSTALVAGVPQNIIDTLTEVSANGLNTIWMITDRVVAVRPDFDTP